mgnify:CR=1 FL=1
MNQSLAGKKIALLVANGFEEVELTEPQRALLAAGAAMQLISPEQALVNGWHGSAWGHYFPVDGALSTALAADYDALIVPGGFRSVEKLAGNAHTMRFLKGFLDTGKPTVLLGDAASLLATAERAEGRQVAANAYSAEKLAAATLEAESVSKADRNLLTVNTDGEDAVFVDAVIAHIGGDAEGGVAEAA